MRETGERRERSSPEPAGGVRRVGRRLFLGLVAAGAGATLLGGEAARALRDAFGAILPTDGFRIYTVTGGFPSATTDTWRLRVEGDVRRPLALDLDTLAGLGTLTRESDFRCVTGWTVPGARWSGAPLAGVLDAAGAPESGGHVLFRSFDGAYHESLTMAQARRPENLVATALDGRPLSPAQGYPARVVVPSMYGYKGTKWLERVIVTDAPVRGYWERQGYDVDGWVGRSNGYGPA